MDGEMHHTVFDHQRPVAKGGVVHLLPKNEASCLVPFLRLQMDGALSWTVEIFDLVHTCIRCTVI